MQSSIDYGYPWWLSYGHLVVFFPALGAAALTYGKRRWLFILALTFTIWSAAAFCVMRFVINVNGEPELPTQAFLRSGTGRVLDLGAGTGRSAIMVLKARPQATLVASDQFGDSFDHHFGHTDTPQLPIANNLKAAGVDTRATIATADMRKLPFEPASFDAVVSAYAIDHLNRQGSIQALAEAHRVLKPNGDLLLMLVENDGWARFAFGPALSHGGTRGATWWRDRIRDSGFNLVEEGYKPLTLYLLAHKK
ncbi:hypothetical protein F183_A25640 [Bryobacterales bacterium F-183]|nr:hypothetical protein F183_A25640 [Bryobacterales bacterium F-183]